MVTGASSGIGAATARASGPGRAIRSCSALAGSEICEELAAAIRAEGGEAAAFHLDLADPASIDGFAKEAAGAFGPVEVLVSNAARIQPGRRARDTARGASTRSCGSTSAGAQRLVHAFGAGMVERRRGDLDLRHLGRGGASPPAHVGLRRVQVGTRGIRHRAADGAGGHGRARHRSCVPGPTLTGMGMDWDPAGHRRGAGRVGALGPGPSLGLPAARRRRRRPSRTPSARHGARTSAWSRSSPRPRIAARRGGTTMTVRDRSLREPPRVSGGEGENGHLDELRRDPIALMARVRAECGDVGEFTIGRTATWCCSPGPTPTSSTSGLPRSSWTRPRPTRS